MPNSGWDSAENARLYADFTSKFPMYHRTSQDLVSRLPLDNASLVVDLACGTGATTEALLERLPAGARVIAVDGSEEMQAVARQRVTDRRVSWVNARLESFDTASDELTQADAVVCNSAIWQADLPATFAAVRKVLRAGGRFAFNIASRFVRLDKAAAAAAAPAAPRSTPSLFELMHAVAVYDYGLVPRPPSGPRRPSPTAEELGELLAAAGLRVRLSEVLEYEQPIDAEYAWSKVPVFTEWMYGTLSYEKRMAALDKAYERLRELAPADRPADRRTPWLVVVAEVE